nr:type I secretion C-terminal target domain-containing protein [Acinetobacter sp. YH12082]
MVNVPEGSYEDTSGNLGLPGTGNENINMVPPVAEVTITPENGGGLDLEPGSIDLTIGKDGSLKGVTEDVAPGTEVVITIQGVDKDGEVVTEEVKTTVKPDGSYEAKLPADTKIVEGSPLVGEAVSTDRNGNEVKGPDKLDGAPTSESKLPTLDFSLNTYTELTENGDLITGNTGAYGGKWETTGNFNTLGYAPNGTGAYIDQDGLSKSTISQTVTNSAVTKDSKLLLDMAWNNGWTESLGNGVTVTISFAGVDLLKIVTPEAVDGNHIEYDWETGAYNIQNSFYAKVTTLNGASFTIDGQTYSGDDAYEWLTYAVDLSKTDYRANPEKMSELWSNFVINLPKDILLSTSNELKVTVDATTSNAADDFIIGTIKLLNYIDGDRLTASAASSTALFSEFNLQDADNDLNKVTLALANTSAGDKLYVKDGLLSDIFDVDTTNGMLTITIKNGQTASIEDWNSIISSAGFYSKAGDANTITVTAYDEAHDTGVSKTVDVNGGITVPTLSVFNLAEQSDDLIFDLLEYSTSESNALRSIDNFEVGSNQKIDISSLLSDDATEANLAEFVTVEYDEVSESAVVSIDRDGTSGTEYESQDLVILLNQTSKVELDDLINNNQIIY